MKKAFLLMIVIFTLSSCVVVKEYEKVNINDPDMKLTNYAIDRFNTNALLYREATSGGNGGKTSGGCGCN